MAAISALLPLPDGEGWSVRHRPRSPSGIEPGLDPRRLRRRPPKHDAVVQAESTCLPELDLERGDAIAVPIERARHLAHPEPRGLPRDVCHELGSTRQRPRLTRGPGPDSARTVACSKIGVSFGVAHFRHGPADAHLPAQALPVK